MAKRTVDGLHVGGGVAVNFLELTEGIFATAPGAAYAPPERGQFRVVAARTVQLLQDAQGVLRSTQTSPGTIRMPAGVPATNDAGDGRQFLFLNDGTGTVTLQDHTGAVIGTVAAGVEVEIVHETGNAWRFFMTELWSRTGTVIHPAVITDAVAIGATAVIAGEILRVVGTTRLEGSTTLTTGQHLVPDGTNGAPSYSFTDETTMGFYRVGAGVLGLSASGGEGFSIDRTNNIDGVTAVGDFVVLRALGIASVGMAWQFDFGLGGAISRVNAQPQGGNAIASFFLSPSGTQTRTFFQMRNASDQSNTGRLIFDFAGQTARLTTDTGGTGLSASTMQFGETGGSGTGGYGTLIDVNFMFSGADQHTFDLNGRYTNGFGTAALPSHSFIGRTNAGMYSPAVGAAALAGGGVERIRVDGTGIGLYTVAPVAQYSTTGTTAGFTAGAGTGVNDDSTFTGNTGATAYTIGDVVRALKLIGLMAA